MTYTEIIDNIQTRIENLIAERFSGTYMNITLEPSDYNPDIDDEITITITVTDQNDDPISNWNVPLTINGTAVATTLTTDTNGQVTYTHSCDDWGICRFSVKSFTCFINVTGWRTYYHNSASNGWYVDVLYNETTVKCIINDPSTLSFTTGETTYLSNCLTDEWIRPRQPVMNFINFQRRLIVREGSPNITKNATSNGTGSIYTQWSWEHRGLP